MAAEGLVISNPVIFTYKQQPGPGHGHGTDINNALLREKYWRTLLLRKLEALDICSIQDKDLFLDEPLELKVSRSSGNSDGIPVDVLVLLQENLSEFEDSLVAMCQQLSHVSPATCPATRGATTLLHLAAALGLARLTCALLHCAAESSNRVLAAEVDALSLDEDGFTPLVSAD